MSNILVTGVHNTNLGGLITAALRWDHHVFTIGLDPDVDQVVDITSTAELSKLNPFPDGLDILINCAGVSYISFLQYVSDEKWENTIDVNMTGIMKTSRRFLPELTKSKGTILNIISSASHVPMTASLAYNASKAAAHMMTLQMARELTRGNNITVFGISPNRLKGTPMSLEVDKEVARVRWWSEDEVKANQNNAMLSGEETDPRQVAEFVAFLLQDKDHHKFLTGCVIPYGA